MGNKCSCLTKNGENEGSINIIEETTNPSSRSVSNSRKRIEKEFMINSVYIRKKEGNPENVNESNFEIDYDFNHTREQKEKLAYLQAVLRGCYARLKFNAMLKQRLKNQTMKLVEKYKSEFKTIFQYKAESNHGPFDQNGWTKYYPRESIYLFNYELKYFGGILFKTDILIYNKKSYYIGSVNLRNQRCGFGILANTAGEKFEGHWVNNKFTGWGRYIDAEGNLYEGHFITNTLTGKGERHSLNGSSYTGEFKNNLKHGKGKEENADHFYEGEFRKDKKEGFGRLRYKVGKDSYDGHFTDNCITGSGIYRWGNGHSYEGTFVNGKMHGRGIYKWPDGSEYEGDYVDNIKEGYGFFKWSNGKTFKGGFKKNTPHGTGIMTLGNEIFEVVFEVGKMIRSNKVELLKPKELANRSTTTLTNKLNSTKNIPLTQSKTSINKK